MKIETMQCFNQSLKFFAGRVIPVKTSKELMELRGYTKRLIDNHGYGGENMPESSITGTLLMRDVEARVWGTVYAGYLKSLKYGLVSDAEMEEWESKAEILLESIRVCLNEELNELFDEMINGIEGYIRTDPLLSMALMMFAAMALFDNKERLFSINPSAPSAVPIKNVILDLVKEKASA